jgi:hypothetical protein
VLPEADFARTPELPIGSAARARNFEANFGMLGLQVTIMGCFTDFFA